MSRIWLARTFFVQMVLLATASQGSAQDENGNGERATRAQIGAQAVGVVTHATPALLGSDLTEGYVTQPSIMLHAAHAGLDFSGTINLEGLTLKRGELNAGIWGEGYMDRRHPHTYLHEAVLSYVVPRVLGADLSLSAGRGFAPFGTDDPMVRPFVKYPSNHHLAQILERLVLIGAIRRDPLIIEGGLFNGDEPLSPNDIGKFDRFGDSWSARASVLPTSWLELQASRADLKSPEQPRGGGLDHKMWHTSARVSREFSGTTVYALVEVGRTGERSSGTEIFHFYTFLAEAAVGIRGWNVAARFERSDRPEEERLIDLFRSVRPATDNSILGTSRWTTGTVHVSRRTSLRGFRAEPFVEIARLHAHPNERPSFFEPANLYGSANLWSLSVGIRTALGMQHVRMGRYGAGQPSQRHTH